jgi:hypothetical protein
MLTDIVMMVKCSVLFSEQTDVPGVVGSRLDTYIGKRVRYRSIWDGLRILDDEPVDRHKKGNSAMTSYIKRLLGWKQEETRSSSNDVPWLDRRVTVDLFSHIGVICSVSSLSEQRSAQ